MLAEYGHKHGQITAPPIPIDEIVEVYLLLTIEMKDLNNLYGVGDVHGALWVNRQSIDVDMSLDPETFPAKRGRYHFTLAHEAGHWRLHRQLYQKKANQLSLLPDKIERPEYICRSSDRAPIEIQANKFAAALLMPREMLKRSWHEWHGSMNPIYLDELQAKQQEILTPRYCVAVDSSRATTRSTTCCWNMPLARWRIHSRFRPKRCAFDLKQCNC